MAAYRYVGRPKKGEEGERIKAILDAALLIFIRDGFSGGSMEKIANQAGASSRTVYHHFRSKTVLLVAVVTTLSERFEEELGSPDPTEDVHVTLQGYGLRMARLVSSPSGMGLARLIISEREKLKDAAYALFMAGPGRSLEWLTQFLSGPAAQRSLIVHDAPRMAALFIDMVASGPRTKALHATTPESDETWLVAHVEFAVAAFIRAFNR